MNRVHAEWSADRATVEDVIRAFEPLAVHVTRRDAGNFPAFDIDDGVSICRRAVWKAVETYDPSRGSKFSSYAISKCRWAIQDALRAVDHLGRNQRRKVKVGDVDEPAFHSADRAVAQSDGDLLFGRDLLAAPEPAGQEAADGFWRAACRGLNQRERLIVVLRFGEGLGFREVGLHVGVSESRVHQTLKVLMPRLASNVRRHWFGEAA